MLLPSTMLQTKIKYVHDLHDLWNLTLFMDRILRCNRRAVRWMKSITRKQMRLPAGVSRNWEIVDRIFTRRSRQAPPPPLLPIGLETLYYIVLCFFSRSFWAFKLSRVFFLQCVEGISKIWYLIQFDIIIDVLHIQILLKKRVKARA